MKLEVDLGGITRSVDLERVGGRLRCLLDGQPIEADAVEVAPGIYSILIGGESLETRVEPTSAGLRVTVAGFEFAATIRDSRQWRRPRGERLDAEGRQQVLAPMPGKVIRVLVKAGDAVEAGQGLLVVEAMKMQNEIQSPKTGTVERLLAAEGQNVNSGEILAIVV